MQPKTGRAINCQTCGTEFYVSAWQLENKDERRRPKFCSRKCKHVAWRDRKMPWATPERNTTHAAGYVLVWAPDHPRAHPKGKRVFEHILVAERMLGRVLEKGEQVHHKDRNKQNNDLSNLIVLTSEEHARLHSLTSPQMQSRKVEIECWECGKRFKVSPSRAHSENPQANRKYCSLPCRHQSWGRQMKAIRKRRN